MPNTTHDARIRSALADLDSQSKPNYTATAKKWSLERTTLAKRHKGQTVSKQAAIAQHHQRLNARQEEVLIEHINRLTDRGMPPTSRIVRNLAEEMISSQVCKNWTGDLCDVIKTNSKVFIYALLIICVKSPSMPLYLSTFMI